MSVPRSSYLAVACLLFALSGGLALAEVPDLAPDKLAALSTQIVDGKLARIYTSVEKAGDWAITHSVAEIQVSKVEKGKFDGKVAYVRFSHRRYIGKGRSPVGAFGQREVPDVGSIVRAYVREGDDGGLDVIPPNGLMLISVGAKETKKTSEPG
jgi:hypothetical protein